MSVNTSAVDILNLRTTNINVRISPMLKIKIMEHGANMGVNLSDYINYALVKQMSGQMEVEETPQYKELEKAYDAAQSAREQAERKATVFGKQYENAQKQLREAQAELTKYEKVLEPYKKSLNEPLTIGKETYRPKDYPELVEVIFKSFKTKN